jgi:hypothetical protein
MRHALPKSILPILLLAILILAANSAAGMGIISIGGTPAIGVSALEVANVTSRPVAPLNSFLLDETYQSIIPLDPGIPLATWEETQSGNLRATLASNITWADSPTRVLTAEDVVTCWALRRDERWDARWALRGIDAMIPIDERTIDFIPKDGYESDDITHALTSPALRLSIEGAGVIQDGTGPFLADQSSSVRELLTTALTHFAGRPYLDEVSIIAYPSVDESVLDFGRGNLDALLITSNERNRYIESSRAAEARTETVGQAIMVLAFNPARLPNPDERRALALAVDRGGVARVVLGENSVVAGDFLGTEASSGNWSGMMDEARDLYSSIPNPSDSFVLLVSDDPAARASAGRLRANWESLGVPVELRNGEGPLALSMEADAVLLSVRLSENGEGVLPQCLALYDRSGWWEIIALALEDEAELLRSVRSLDPDADLEALGSALQDHALMIPVARYDILFAPGPGISLVPSAVYPGSVLWRAFMGQLPEAESPAVETEPEQDEEQN